jgi:hypothetical protein
VAYSGTQSGEAGLRPLLVLRATFKERAEGAKLRAEKPPRMARHGCRCDQCARQSRAAGVFAKQKLRVLQPPWRAVVKRSKLLILAGDDGAFSVRGKTAVFTKSYSDFRKKIKKTPKKRFFFWKGLDKTFFCNYSCDMH